MNSPAIAQLLSGRTLGSAGNSFVIAEWRDPGEPQRSDSASPRWIAPLHLHNNDDEAWYVLEGKLCVLVGDDTVEAAAGTAVLVPGGTPHTYWNPDAAPVRYLLIMTPRIHQLIQAIHATQDRSADGMRAVFKSHDSELL